MISRRDIYDVVVLLLLVICSIIAFVKLIISGDAIFGWCGLTLYILFAITIIRRWDEE